MKAYPPELRQSVLAAVDSGRFRIAEVAAQFGVSQAWVRRLLQRRSATGSITPIHRCGAQQAKLDATQRRTLEELVRKDPRATLADLLEQLGADVATTTIWRALRDLGLTRRQMRRSRGGS